MAAIGQGIPGATTNPNLTTTLAPEVATYYDKVFLDRAQYGLVLKEGSQSRTHPANEGRTVNFTRRIPIGIDTSPLGEMSNPVVCAMSACTISMTLSEYGKTVVTSKFMTLVGIDSGQKESIELVGQNMGETLNRLVGTELQTGGTAYYPNGHTVSTLAAGDVLDACNIRLMLRTLELNRSMAYKDGMFMGKTDSYSKYKLLSDSTWINAKTYSDVKGLYKGEMGELYQVRWLLNGDTLSGTEAAGSAASTVVRFYTFVHGDNAFGTYDLAQDKPRLYILPNQVDSNSPAGRVSYISWAGSYATKVLNADWVLSGRFTAS
jgi:N4-gp56 family major capsid protein